MRDVLAEVYRQGKAGEKMYGEVKKAIETFNKTTKVFIHTTGKLVKLMEQANIE